MTRVHKPWSCWILLRPEREEREEVEESSKDGSEVGRREGGKEGGREGGKEGGRGPIKLGEACLINTNQWAKAYSPSPSPTLLPLSLPLTSIIRFTAAFSTPPSLC